MCPCCPMLWDQGNRKVEEAKADLQKGGNSVRGIDKGAHGFGWVWSKHLGSPLRRSVGVAGGAEPWGWQREPADGQLPGGVPCFRLVRQRLWVLQASGLAE